MLLLVRWASALGFAILGAVLLRRPTATQRTARGNAWATKHWAYVDGSLVADFDRLLDTRRRVGVWLLVALIGMILVLPLPSVWGLWGWIAGLVALSTVLSSVFLIRWISAPAPGPRVARARRVELEDLLPRRLRALMWGSVLSMAVLAVMITVTPAEAGARSFAFVLLALLGGSAAALEVLGRLLAHAPEPAVDAAHLYWQDVMRAEAVTTQARQIAWGAAMGCMTFWAPDPWQVWPGAQLFAWAASLSLLGLGAVAGFVEAFHPVDYLRARLWPALRPGEVVGPATKVVT